MHSICRMYILVQFDWWSILVLLGQDMLFRVELKSSLKFVSVMYRVEHIRRAIYTNIDKLSQQEKSILIKSSKLKVVRKKNNHIKWITYRNI